jgi:hypothetical protein
MSNLLDEFGNGGAVPDPGVLAQGFVRPKQVFYLLSHTSNPTWWGWNERCQMGKCLVEVNSFYFVHFGIQWDRALGHQQKPCGPARGTTGRSASPAQGHSQTFLPTIQDYSSLWLQHPWMFPMVRHHGHSSTGSDTQDIEKGWLMDRTVQWAQWQSKWPFVNCILLPSLSFPSWKWV